MIDIFTIKWHVSGIYMFCHRRITLRVRWRFVRKSTAWYIHIICIHKIKRLFFYASIYLRMEHSYTWIHLCGTHHSSVVIVKQNTHIISRLRKTTTTTKSRVAKCFMFATFFYQLVVESVYSGSFLNSPLSKSKLSTVLVFIFWSFGQNWCVGWKLLVCIHF